MQWTYRGRAFKFGDDVHIDGEIMPLRLVIAREMDPQVLKNHVMQGLDPDFPQKVKPGDIIIGGQRFGCGNPHPQGFLGIKALGLGIIAEWMPRGAYRNCVMAGIPTLPNASGICKMMDNGDQLQVNFQTGALKNITKKTSMLTEPMPPVLQEIVAAGGTIAHMKQELIGQGVITRLT